MRFGFSWRFDQVLQNDRTGGVWRAALSAYLTMSDGHKAYVA